MSNARRLVRQTLTIARRDFTATVFTPTFLLFLFAPLIMLSFGLIGGLGASSVASGDIGTARTIAIAGAADATLLRDADRRLRKVFRRSELPPELYLEAPAADSAAQARKLTESKDYDAAAVMYGPLARPTILVAVRGGRAADYLSELAEQALRAKQVDGTLSKPTRISLDHSATASAGGKSQAGFFTVFGIFFLTLLLAGQAVGTMAEERSNKVIEVLAAAVPLESVFLGKLVGMFGVACLFVGFWATIAFNVGALIPPEALRAFSGVGPAVGFPAFVALFFAYFTMAYMLLGAVFLGVGAQAATMREIQMLSLPITFVQVAMFGLATAAASNPGGWIALVAELFPLSSPFAMAAHAANRPEIWPHVAALAWQLLWVSIVITIAARAFRRGVLQSGPGVRRRWFRPTPVVDMGVS